MAKGKNVDGNKYARRIKNYDMIGKGEKQTQEQILAKGPKMPANEKAKQIIADKEKGQ